MIPLFPRCDKGNKKLSVGRKRLSDFQKTLLYGHEKEFTDLFCFWKNRYCFILLPSKKFQYE